VVVPRWLGLANAAMDADPGAIISGRYACKNARGLLGLAQRNEFARECRMIDRRGAMLPACCAICPPTDTESGRIAALKHLLSLLT
jgi:hypothetical protein